LEDWLRISGVYEAILLVDKGGAVVVSAPSGLVTGDIRDDKTVKGATKGELTISDFHKSDIVSSIDEKSNGWTLSIAAPILHGREVTGVLVSYIKWSRLEALISSLRVGKTGFVFVLNSQNQSIVHPSRALYGLDLRHPKSIFLSLTTL
jgi:hypothetical protein